ncbi:MAG: ECF transporter S component [Clostridiales Family XIII bacterium]|nr:ECF transporter S component [Clostridiales Family XIII bacterium]
MKNNVERMIMTAMMTALIAAMTAVVAIPVPFTNGYIHPGDSMVFLAVLALGWRRGAVAAGLGSALADVFLGFVFWAPWTLLIKGCMAMTAGLIMEKCRDSRRNVAISCGATALLWLLFNVVVQAVVAYAANSSPASLAQALGAAEAGALGAALGSVQSQLMLAALLIPVGLAAAAFALRRKEGVSVPLGHVVGMTGGGLLMVFGYYLAGGLIYGNFAVSALGIPANMLQFVGGFLIAALLSAALQRTPAGRRFALGPKSP